MYYYYPVQISSFWEQLGRNRNGIVKNSRISGHPEPELDIRYIPGGHTVRYVQVIFCEMSLYIAVTTSEPYEHKTVDLWLYSVILQIYYDYYYCCIHCLNILYP